MSKCTIHPDAYGPGRCMYGMPDQGARPFLVLDERIDDYLIVAALDDDRYRLVVEEQDIERQP